MLFPVALVATPTKGPTSPPPVRVVGMVVVVVVPDIVVVVVAPGRRVASPLLQAGSPAFRMKRHLPSFVIGSFQALRRNFPFTSASIDGGGALPFFFWKRQTASA